MKRLKRRTKKKRNVTVKRRRRALTQRTTPNGSAFSRASAAVMRQYGDAFDLLAAYDRGEVDLDSNVSRKRRAR